jgi:hypothetical protein
MSHKKLWATLYQLDENFYGKLHVTIKNKNVHMKMRNEDLKKITEIKQYLLNPPASFRLYDFAPNYLRDAITVLNNYPAAKDVIDYLQNLTEQFDNKTINQSDVIKTLKDASVEINKLTSR